jgi:hypothetical protein
MATRVIARRDEHVYLVRYDDGTDRLLDTQRHALTIALPAGAWVKDAYWDEATMPDAVLKAWLAEVPEPPQPKGVRPPKSP